MTKIIKISDIQVSDRERGLDKGWVEVLADDIAEKTQLQPIGVRKVDNGFALVFGEHRLAATKLLGKDTIEAKILTVTKSQAKIIEIDENILRMPFSPLSFARALLKRKFVYEEAFPLSKNGAAGLISMNTPSDDIQVAKVCDLDTDQNVNVYVLEGQQSFSESTADRLGVSQSKIQKAIWLAQHFNPNAEKILTGHTIMDNAAQLHALAKLPAEEQEWVAESLVNDGVKNVAEALALMTGAMPETAAVKTFNKAVDTWVRANTTTKAQIIETFARHGLPAGYTLMINGEAFK